MPAQLGFSFDEPAARRTDPETSKQAALAAKEMAERHHKIILDCLKANGPLGKDGIASRTSLTGVAVARRTVELERLGRIHRLAIELFVAAHLRCLLVIEVSLGGRCRRKLNS